MQRWFALMWAVLFTACASTSLATEGHASELAVYPLDESSRLVGEGAKLPCQDGTLELVSYRGDIIRYQKPVRIHPAFRAHLTQFEGIVEEVARKHFGRAPRSILHFGAYACRAMRNRTHLVSEHAFGNAIDVAGFDFPAVPRKQRALYDSLDKPLRRAFSVRVDKHWRGEGSTAPFSAFLHDLAERLIERPDVFRALVGPGWPGHDNHFHLAHPPYRMVKLDELQRWFW